MTKKKVKKKDSHEKYLEKRMAEKAEKQRLIRLEQIKARRDVHG